MLVGADERKSRQRSPRQFSPCSSLGAPGSCVSECRYASPTNTGLAGSGFSPPATSVAEVGAGEFTQGSGAVPSLRLIVGPAALRSSGLGCSGWSSTVAAGVLREMRGRQGVAGASMRGLRASLTIETRLPLLQRTVLVMGLGMPGVASLFAEGGGGGGGLLRSLVGLPSR